MAVPDTFGVTPATAASDGGVVGSTAADPLATNGQQAEVTIEETIFNGAVFSSVNVPASVKAGETINVNGVVGFDCPICVVDRAIRVVLEASHLNEQRIDDVGKLSGRGQTAQFSFSIPAPQEAGQEVTIRLKAERNPPIGGWETDNTEGPFSVNIVSTSTDVVNTAVAWAPWAIGGGAIGVGGAQVTDRPLVAGGLVGAGAGVSAKILSTELGGANIDLGFPLMPVVATAALLGAGALLLSQVGGLPSFGSSGRSTPPRRR